MANSIASPDLGDITLGSVDDLIKEFEMSDEQQSESFVDFLGLLPDNITFLESLILNLLFLLLLYIFRLFYWSPHYTFPLPE